MYSQPELTKVITQCFVAVDGKTCQMPCASVCFKWAQNRQMVEVESGSKAERCSSRRKRFFQALGMTESKYSHLLAKTKGKERKAIVVNSAVSVSKIPTAIIKKI